MSLLIRGAKRVIDWWAIHNYRQYPSDTTDVTWLSRRYPLCCPVSISTIASYALMFFPHDRWCHLFISPMTTKPHIMIYTFYDCKVPPPQWEVNYCTIYALCSMCREVTDSPKNQIVLLCVQQAKYVIYIKLSLSALQLLVYTKINTLIV